MHQDIYYFDLFRLLYFQHSFFFFVIKRASVLIKYKKSSQQFESKIKSLFLSVTSTCPYIGCIPTKRSKQKWELESSGRPPVKLVYYRQGREKCFFFCLHIEEKKSMLFSQFSFFLTGMFSSDRNPTNYTAFVKVFFFSRLLALNKPKVQIQVGWGGVKRHTMSTLNIPLERPKTCCTEWRMVVQDKPAV